MGIHAAKLLIRRLKINTQSPVVGRGKGRLGAGLEEEAALLVDPRLRSGLGWGGGSPGAAVWRWRGSLGQVRSRGTRSLGRGHENHGPDEGKEQVQWERGPWKVRGYIH